MEDEELFTFGNTKKICIDAARLDALSKITRKAKKKKTILERSEDSVVAVISAKESSDESSHDVHCAVVEVDSPPLSPLLLLSPSSPPQQSTQCVPCSPSASTMKSLPVLLKADALVSMLRSPFISESDGDTSAPLEVIAEPKVQSFNLRVRLRGQIFKYSVNLDTTLQEVCALVASQKDCDPRQVFLSHKTSTLDLYSSVSDNGLTTADIIDAVVMDAPQEKDSVIHAPWEDHSHLCVFSIRSSTTSIEYSVNKSEPISKAMCAFADSLGTVVSKMRFMFDGGLLDPEHTVQDLGLENGDIIDAELIENRKGKMHFSFPCIHTPSLFSPDVLSALECIQARWDVALFLLDQFGMPKALRDISTTKVGSSCDQVTDFCDFLNIPGSSPFHGLEWFWQDNRGQFNCYSPDVCSLLTRERQSCPIAKVTVTIDAKTFVIDLASMCQFNVQTGRPRAVQCTDLTPCWYFEADNKEMNQFSFVDAGTLEEAFRARQQQQTHRECVTVTVKERKHNINFALMQLEDIDTKTCMKIERRTVSRREAVFSNCNLVFEAYGLEANLDRMFQEVGNLLQEQLVTLERPNFLSSLPTPALTQSVMAWTTRYFVHASIAGNCLSLVGVGGYAEKVMEKLEQQVVTLTTPSSKYPVWWEPQMTKIELKVVLQSTSEWEKVASLVRLTLKNAHLVKLERIQNQWLWDRYVFAKERMAEKNGGEVNEKELFHGTRVTPPEKIYRSEQGFDFRYSAMGSWGSGTYFAVNASYSHRYAFNVQEGGTALHQMFLANVLTGVSYYSQPDPSLRRPPLRQCGQFEDQLYDSVQGNTGNSDVYMVYDHEKAYPAYLLTYSMEVCAPRAAVRKGRRRPRKK